MKDPFNRALLAVFLLSLAAHIFTVLIYLEVINLGLGLEWYMFYEAVSYLALGFHVVPAFCLQLLLCRTTRKRIAVIPPALLILGVLLMTVGYFNASGWDGLGWLVLLLLCIAPAAGFLLAWAAYGGTVLYQRSRSHG